MLNDGDAKTIGRPNLIETDREFKDYVAFIILSFSDSPEQSRNDDTERPPSYHV
jgi:hypothetical protein